MATIGDRASTWTNSDGLVVGFGQNKPAYEGAAAKNYGGKGGAKVASVQFDYAHINAAKAVNVPVPAGSRVLDVRVVVGTAWAGAGNALIVGDGSDADGFITAAGQGAVAALTAGAVANVDGVYAFGATDTGAAELKLYDAADTIDVTSADTDWTAGTATLVVTYL